MSETLTRIKGLASVGDVLISAHGYDELADDEISVSDAVASVPDATLVEDYPDYGKGPCCLVLQWDAGGDPIHVVWGIPAGVDRPAVLITAYRPTLSKWTDDFLRRRL